MIAIGRSRANLIAARPGCAEHHAIGLQFEEPHPAASRPSADPQRRARVSRA